jgi:hypothetical protein
MSASPEAPFYTMPEARRVAKHLQSIRALKSDMRGAFLAACDKAGIGGKENGALRIIVFREIKRVDPNLLPNKPK